jgi:hypothetical protein
MRAERVETWVALALGVSLSIVFAVRMALDVDVARHYTTWCNLLCMGVTSGARALVGWVRRPWLDRLYTVYMVPLAFAVATFLGGASTYLFLVPREPTLLAESRRAYAEWLVQLANIALHWAPCAWTGWLITDPTRFFVWHQAFFGPAPVPWPARAVHGLGAIVLFSAAYFYLFDPVAIYGFADETVTNNVSKGMGGHLLAWALTEALLWWLYVGNVSPFKTK